MNNSAGETKPAVVSTESLPARARVLFVDDEPAVLSVLRVILRTVSAEWEPGFAASGEQALAAMAQHPYDVVISDMRMPGMNGAQLLNQVMRLYPATVRIVMSGYADLETVLKCVGAVHQYLSKPFSPAALCANLIRIRRLRARLGNAEMQTLAARLTTLPSVPTVYLEMVKALESPHTTVAEIAVVVARDPALAAKTLQLANSAFLGYGSSVRTIPEAIQVLGLGVLRSLALAVPLFRAFDSHRCRGFHLETVWAHSVRTGVLARRLMLAEAKDETRAEETFAAGLLHDLGKLVLAENLPEPYARLLERATRETRTLHELEAETFEASHAEVGGYLLGLWSLPAPLVEAVSFHHRPSQSEDAVFSPLTAVHAANVLLEEQDATTPEPARAQFDEIYLDRLSLLGQIPSWRSLSLEAGTGPL